MRRAGLGRLAKLAVLVAAGAGVLPAVAQTSCGVTVTSLADSGAGSLRNAIAAAAASGANTICFQTGLQGTISLQSTLTIGSVVDIMGPGASLLTISGAGNALQPILIDLQNTALTPVTLQGFTISGGSAKIGGGVRVAGGYVTLFQDVVTGNTADAGGGIYNQGTLTLQNTSVNGNTAKNGLGGGIFNIAGGYVLTLTSDIEGNTSNTNGGGIANNGTLTLEGTTMYSNSGAGGGGIYNAGQFTTNGAPSSLTNNLGSTAGGAFYNDTGASATITDMWMDSNAASGSNTQLGGAIYNAGTLTVSESTFSANTASDLGGAIYNLGGLTLTDSTLSTNIAISGGGALANDTISSSDSLTLHNDILSGNTTSTSGATITDCLGCGTPSSDNLIGVPVKLGPLSFNGGANRTFMPLPGSPAIGGGVYSIDGGVVVPDTTDERGLSRITVNGNTVSVDVGAVQTHYSSVNFASQPASTGVDQALAAAGGGAIFATVVETDGETTNYPQGVPVTVSLGTTNSVAPATLSGTLNEYPGPGSNGIEASFADLSVNVDGSYYLTATTYPNEPGGQQGTYTASSGNFTISGSGIYIPVITWNPASLVYGTPLPASELNAVATENGYSDPGTFSYIFIAGGQPINVGQVYPAGSYSVQVTYTSANGGSPVSQLANLVIAQGTPTVALVTPPSLLPGTALNTANLHASAVNAAGVSVPGTFSYSSALGSVPGAGSHTVTATFVPNDTTDYAGGSGKATFTVLTPLATSTLLGVYPTSATAGTPVSFEATVSPTGAGAVGGTVAITGPGTTSVGSTSNLFLYPGGTTFTVPSASTGLALSGSTLIPQSADMNGDGVADLILINGTSLEVLLADPANPGTYAKSVALSLYSACAYVSGMAIGDVNGDGLNDIVAACQNHPAELNGGGPIVVFLNQGNGSFATPVVVGGQGSSPMQAAVVALGDFDADGKLDLGSIGAACPNGGSACIAFQHGNGDGTFGAATYTSIDGGAANDNGPAQFASLQAADFNGDGRPDLSFIYTTASGVQTLAVWVSSTATTPLSFGLNTGGQACSPLPCYDANASVAGPQGNSVSQLVAADLNGDGLADLVAVTAPSDGGDGSANTVSVALNTPSSGVVHLPAATTDTTYAGAESIAVADFNQDGFGDVAVYSYTSNQLSLLIGDGTGAFSNQFPQATVPLNAANGGDFVLYPVFSVGDANGDGFPDVLFVQPTLNNTANAQMAILSGPTAASSDTVAAPQQTTTYTGTTAPSSKLWAASTGQATLTVTASTVTLNWQPAGLTYGTPMPQSELDATATVNGAAGTGTFVYTFTSPCDKTCPTINVGQVYQAGLYYVQVAFTPTGSKTTYTLDTTLSIAQASPTVTLATPATLLHGATLSLANAHGLATGVGGALLPGTFAYSPALGSALSSGEKVMITFTPADTVDYVSGVSAATTVTLLAAEATSTTLSASSNPNLSGVPVTLEASVAPVSGGGAVPGTTAFSVTGSNTPIATQTLALNPAAASFVAGTAQTYTGGNSNYQTYSADFNGDGVADLLIAPAQGQPLLLFSVPGATATLAQAIPLNLGSGCSYTIGLAVGDVNGDGLPDVAAACVNSDTGATTLVVVLNEGAGVFVASPTVTTLSPGIGAVQMVLGNFDKSNVAKNGAAIEDLVVVTNCTSDQCSGATLDYLQGDGAGNFALENYELINNSSTADGFANLLAGDFNGDGSLDVAFLHASGAAPYGVAEIWKNDKTSPLSFGNPVVSGTCQGPCYAADATVTAGNGLAYLASLISGDFNLDGLPDLAMVTFQPSEGYVYSSLSVALNKSSGGALSFPAATTDTPGNGAQTSIVTADFDGDGRPDLALYDSFNNTVRVLHGAGDGTFSFTEPKLVFPVAASLASYPELAVGDTNGDGYPDLLVSQVTEGQDNQIYSAQQFLTSGPTVAATTISAPAVSTEYTAATTPAVGYWGPSAGKVTLQTSSFATTTTLSFSPAAPVYGQAVTLVAQVNNAVQGASVSGGSVTFTQGAGAGTTLQTVPIDATGKATYLLPTLPSGGVNLFSASYGGDAQTGEQPSSALDQALTVAKYVPVISWGPLAAITTETPLGAAQLDAVAQGVAGSTLSLQGTLVYTNAAGAVLTSGETLPAGTDPLTVTFTPSTGESVDYASAVKTISIVVNKSTTQTTLAITPAAGTGGYTYGQALTLSAMVTNGVGMDPVTSGTVTFAANGVTLQSVPVTNGAAALSGQVLGAGQEVVTATYGATATENGSSAGAQTVQINKATPTLTWAPPAAISTTTPLGAAQLDAAATGVNGGTLAGSFVYVPAAGTFLSAGAHTLSVTFTPTDAADYGTATKSVTIEVNATNTQTTLTVAPVSSTYGQPLALTATVTNTTGSTVVNGGTVTFTSDSSTLQSVTVVNGAASLTGVVLHGGQHVIGAVYAGTSGEVGSTAGAKTVQVAKATPTLTWATPAPITTTTPLSSTQLDAAAAGVNGAALVGSFVYVPAAGTTLSAGTHTLSVTFTPTEGTDYSTASTTVQILVGDTATRTALTVTPASSIYGQALALAATVTNTTGSAPVNGGTVSFTSDNVAIGSMPVVNGAATLSGVTTLTAGTHVLDAVYSPATGETGSTATTKTVTIGKATPTLTWATPAAISSTTPLSAEQLDATAAGVGAGTGTTGALAGTFVYTPASGTLTVGTHTLSVTFTPTDAVDYATATKSVQIQVVNTNTQVALTVSPTTPTFGQTVTLTAQVTNTTGTTVVNSGSVVFASDNGTLQTVAVVNGAASYALSTLTGGQHLLTASYTGATGTGEGASAAAAQTIAVAKAAPVLTWATPGQIASTTALSATQLNATAAGLSGATLAGSFAYSPAAGSMLTVGTHPLSVTFTPTDAIDYATATKTVQIQVVPELIELASISPATAQLSNTPLPVTLTGSGFPPTAVVQLNGTTLATKVISTTQLQVTVPAANLVKAGTLSFTIYDPASQAISNAATLSVTAPVSTAMITVPATVTSAAQPTVGLTLANSYPVDIAGTLTLTFTPSGADGVDDPAVQFSTGGRVFNFTIPAGTTTGPTAMLQTGTVEGTISVATLLTAGGADVTPADLSTPAGISIAASAPTVTGVTFTNVNGLITVVVTGFSNTREMTEANFVFTGPGAVTLSNAGVTVPAASLFGTWYTSTPSASFGSMFLYTQTFQLSDTATDITGVAVTLTNTAGTSTSVSSQ